MTEPIASNFSIRQLQTFQLLKIYKNIIHEQNFELMVGKHKEEDIYAGRPHNDVELILV